MANIQKHFEKFHDAIRVDYETSAPLREKRDIILKRIRKYLRDNNLPGVDELLQGSYAMKTGVKPIAGLEYDIDVALRFGIKDTEYTAQQVREWIHNSVKGHTKEVCPKGPCDRVAYTGDGYHVDLVSYAVWEDMFHQDQFRLAHKKSGWRPADPPRLLAHVDDAMAPYQGTEDAATSTNQFRRCVRYLRRSSDVAIPKESDSKPTGLGFVLLAIRSLQPTKSWDGKPDDRKALENMLRSVLGLFPGRIVLRKPVPEGEDMFARLSDPDMDALKGRFKLLLSDLEKAGQLIDPADACKLLTKHFGDDFPVPEPEETGKKTSAPAIVPSSSSGA